MGICFTKARRKIVLVMVGLDNAGKTSTAKGIVGQTPNDVAPTLGFALFKMKQRNFDITIYDVGGSKTIRDIWRNYLAESHGFIFVVDSSDTDRFLECQDVLHTLLKNPAVSGKPVLILANKQDINGALDELEISQILDVEALVNEVKCRTRVENGSAIKITRKKLDHGVSTGFLWLLNTIEHDYNKLEEKVSQDVALQREQEVKERIIRDERIKILLEERAKLPAETDNTDTPMIKEDPFKPLATVVKEINDKEIRQSKEYVNPSTTTLEQESSNEPKHLESANRLVKNASELISNSPFETAEWTTSNKPMPDYEMFEIVGPPGTISDEKQLIHEVISRQSTIEENDDVISSPKLVSATGPNEQKRKKIFRRKNKTAPLPPVQNHSMLRDLPPLSPIGSKPITEENKGVMSWGLAEELETSNENPSS